MFPEKANACPFWRNLSAYLGFMYSNEILRNEQSKIIMCTNTKQLKQ